MDQYHSVNFGRPWLPRSDCDHGLITVPYLDGETLRIGKFDGVRVNFLWLIPITSAEVALKKSQGVEALQDLFDGPEFQYADPERKSVV